MDNIITDIDFKSLHNLNNLINNENEIKKLKNKTLLFCRDYFISHLKNIDDVLEYIPENEYSEYKLSFLDTNYHLNLNYRKLTTVCDLLKKIKEINPTNIDDIYTQMKLINPNNRNIFLVNTQNKYIDIYYGFEEHKEYLILHNILKSHQSNNLFYDIDQIRNILTLSYSREYSFYFDIKYNKYLNMRTK